MIVVYTCWQRKFVKHFADPLQYIKRVDIPRNQLIISPESYDMLIRDHSNDDFFTNTKL